MVNFDDLRAKIRKLLGIDHTLRPLAESLNNLQLDRELKAKAWSLVDQAELESIDNIKLEDVRENLSAINQLITNSSVEVVFVTMRSNKSAYPLLLKLGLLQLAEKVITRDDYNTRREQLEGIKNQSRNKKIVFIGDTSHDEKTASEISLPFVKVSSYKELPLALARALNLCSIWL
ncbi:MAG: hypothetical protein QXK88_03375 [Desulfurococcaceae archaeon]